MNDLVIVYPMKSRTGFIQYLQFASGSNKGSVKQGEVWNDPFKLGQMTEDRMNYTAAAVVEESKIDSISGTDFEVTPMWTPLASIDKVTVTKADGTAKVYEIVAVGKEEADAKVSVEVSSNGKTGVINFASGDTFFVAGSTVKYGYKYDNIVIPQGDIPQFTAHMEGKELVAKARRIAVYY